MFNAQYAYDYLHYLADPNRDEALMYVNNHYYQHGVYASIANKYSILPVWDVTLSTDYQFNLLNTDLTDFAYIVRHTFATLVLNKGIPLETLQKVLGHKTIISTQVYAELVNSKIGEDMDRMREKIDGMFRLSN